MHVISQVFIVLVALLHLYFLWMEMFAWTTVGRKTFRSIPPELFEPTKVLAANQGLYNGFLAAGLVWSLCINEQSWQRPVASFFLICITIAGFYGAITASRKIFFAQALPALIALLSLYLL
jgi:putative membrane protein